jgi:hypothetical protein
MLARLKQMIHRGFCDVNGFAREALWISRRHYVQEVPVTKSP